MSLLLLTLLCAAPPEPIVVHYTVEPGLDPRKAQLFAAHLGREIDKHEGVHVAPAEADAAARPAGCELERTCLAKLAAAAGGDLVVLARTATLGTARVVTLKRLRISTGEIEQSVTKAMEGAGDQGLLLAIGPAIAELLPDHPLRAGASAGVEPAFIARWDPPPLPRWAFFGGVGVSLAAFATAGWFTAKKLDAEDEWEALFAGPGPVDGATLHAAEERAQSAATRANVALGVGLGLAAATAVMAFFTDWSPELDAPLLDGAAGLGVPF